MFILIPASTGLGAGLQFELVEDQRQDTVEVVDVHVIDIEFALATGRGGGGRARTSTCSTNLLRSSSR